MVKLSKLDGCICSWEVFAELSSDVFALTEIFGSLIANPKCKWVDNEAVTADTVSALLPLLGW